MGDEVDGWRGERLASALVHLRGRRKGMRGESGTQVRSEGSEEEEEEEEKDARLVEYMH